MTDTRVQIERAVNKFDRFVPYWNGRRASECLLLTGQNDPESNSMVGI